MSKIKISKVIPYDETTMSKTQPFVIDDKKYINAPTNLQQNSTGSPLYLYLIFILPEANHDYQYLKIDIKVQNLEFKTIIHKKQQTFKGIKRVNLKRQTVFQFIPNVKGSYALSVDCAYRPQFFVQSSQPPPQKRDNNQMTIKCDQPFQVREYILSEDKVSSITFPLFLQYSIESKLFGQQLTCNVEFLSDKFKFKQLHNEKIIKLKKEQIYYLMYEIQPKSLKEVMSEKGITIGTLNIKYGVKGVHQKKTSLKASNKYVFFKANTITKQVPKKDIVEVEAIFSKIYNVSFNLGNLKLVINQKQMPEVKILKTSVDRINLDQNRSVSVIFSVICLKSGPVHLKGITLQGNEDITVYFINELTLNVGIQNEKKAQIMLENTSQFYVDSLL